MKTINRHEFLAEQLVREHIRKRIKHNLRHQRLAENKIRGIVKRILEAETGTEEPSVYTGINVLADLLERIVPVLQDDYKMLTTSINPVIISCSVEVVRTTTKHCAQH